MKEFDFDFDEGLLKGLRRFSSNPRNSQNLTDCHNWMPMEQGLEVHEQLVLIGAAVDYFLLLGKTLGSDLLTDGALENWTGNDPDSWSVSEFGTSTITDEAGVIHGGSHSCKMNVSASGNQVGIAQIPSGGYTVGTEYILEFWAYGDGTNSIHVVDDFNDIGGLLENPIPPVAWTKYQYVWTANAQSDRIQISNTSMSAPAGAPAWAFYIDDIFLATTVEQTGFYILLETGDKIII